MTYNAASRKDIRTAEKAQVAISTIDREVISGLMSVANGRHWIHERLAEAGVFRDPFSADPSVHAYQAGRRSEGIRLFNDVVLYAAENFIVMIREAYERSAADNQRLVNNHRVPADGRVTDDPDGDDAGNYDEFGRWIDPADHAGQGTQPTQ